MPMDATLALSDIEYFASAKPQSPLVRPKCGQCESCCGMCSHAGFESLKITTDGSVPAGQCMSEHTGPTC